MPKNPDTQRRYWAALSGEDFGNELADKVDSYLSAPLISTRKALVWRAFAYFYSFDLSSGMHGSSSVIRGGEQGELAKVRVNHARALSKTQLNLVTNQRFTWDPKAINTDSESIKEVLRARQLLEFYWNELRVESKALQVAEHGLGPGAGEGFAHATWNPFAGDEFLPDPVTGQISMSGDVDVAFVPTWDVIRDPTLRSWSDGTWVIVRRYFNKFDIAEQYAPEQAALVEPKVRVLRDAILDQPRTKDFQDVSSRNWPDDNMLEVFYFYHKRTPALPKGRETIFLADGTLLSNPSPLRLSCWPLYRFAAGELTGTPFPYSPFLEILGIQELMDSLHTSVASNQTTFATQLVAIQRGSDISPNDVASGMQVIEVDDMQQAPRPVQLTQSPAEVFSYLESLQSQQELLVGLNNIVRGQASSGEQSGSSQALLAAQALQNASDIQLNWIKFLEELGNGVFEMLNTMLSAPRQIAIVGQANRSLVEPFEMERGGFKRIKRIQIQLSNVLMQSPAARQEAADKLVQMGLVKTLPQYQTLLDTGRLEPLTKAVSHELILIEDENEKLQAGEVPPVLATDDHMLHSREHKTLLDSTLARNDPELIQRVLTHISEHERLWFTTPPQLLMMTGQQPPPMMAPPMPGGPGPTDGSQNVEPGVNAPAGPPMPQGNPQAGQPSGMPQMPVNPQTGMPFDPASGQ